MQITIDELKALTSERKATVNDQTLVGFRIVVMDRGFVHCGKVFDCGEYYRLDDAKNIRVWGTTNGIGELRDGPLPNTKLDELGKIEVSKKAVLFMILCSREF